MRQSLAEAIATAPYASLSENEAAALARQLKGDAHVVVRTLEREAATHDMCGNATKADTLSALADRVRAISIGVPMAMREMKGPRTFAVCPTCEARIALRVPKDAESMSGVEYVDHYLAEHA